MLGTVDTIKRICFEPEPILERLRDDVDLATKDSAYIKRTYGWPRLYDMDRLMEAAALSWIMDLTPEQTRNAIQETYWQYEIDPATIVFRQE